MNDVLAILYRSGRCGLYHASITQGRIRLLGGDIPALIYERERRYLTINPHKLVPVLKDHLETYVADLMNPANVTLRTAFEERFDYLMRSDPIGSSQ